MSSADKSSPRCWRRGRRVHRKTASPWSPDSRRSARLSRRRNKAGQHWLATLSEALSGRQLDYNDLGYLDRKNDSLTYADLTYRTLDPWWRTTDTSTTLAVSHRQTLDGIRLEDNLRLSAFATFTNFWAANFTLYYRAAHFDDRETGDGTALERAALGGTELWVGSDSRRLFTGSFWGQFQKLADGVQVQGYASLMMRP